MRSPGIIPAIKRSLTEAPEALPYMIKGMLGGIITPSPPATATTAVENVLSYPTRFISGIVIAPVPATLAIALPEIAPKQALEITAAFAGPPCDFPVRAVARSIKNVPAPLVSSRAAKIINSTT